MLISAAFSTINAQVAPSDTLKKVSVDSLANDDEMLENPVTYSGEDSVVYLGQKGEVLFFGKSHVTYEDIDLKSEYIELDYKKNLVTAYGKKDSTGKNVGTPVFKDATQEMNAEKIMYNVKTKKGKIFNALTNQGELLVIGKEIKKDSSNIVYMKDMRCIPCKDADARTVFRATRAKIIPDDKIVTGPMYLEIGGVPTPLALPFGFFPNTKKQKNGILLPMPGKSATQGFFLQDGGYYFGISNQTDMIVKGDVYANGSWAVRTTNDYLVRYKASGAVNLGYKSFNFGDKDDPKQFQTQKAYSIAWQHAQDPKANPGSRFSASVNYVNNQQINRINSQNSGQFLNNTFQSNINYTKTFKLSSLSVNALHNQNSISKTQNITFPSLTFNVNRFFPFKRANAVRQNVFDKLGMNYLLEANNTLSGTDSTIFRGKVLDSLKYGVRHTLPISTNFNLFKYITVTPALNLSSVMYMKSVSKEFVRDEAHPTGAVVTNTVNGFASAFDGSFSTAMNTKVFFDYVFRKGRLQQIRHLLIPTITYAFKPDLGKEKYGYWRNVQSDTLGNTRKYSIFEGTLYGGPAQGKQNSMTVNLSNNIEAKTKKKTDTGYVYNKSVIIQNISFLGSYNFAADSFKMSNVSATMRTKLIKNVDLVASSDFDPYAYDKERGRRVQQFAYEYNHQLARFNRANFAITTSIGSNMLEAYMKKKNPSLTNGVEGGAPNDLNSNAKLPWNLYFSYGLALSSSPGRKVILPTQTLNFSGDLMPTKFWKIGITSGFDFINQKLSYTAVNIYRDLKCWEARIDWVPFGPNKQYKLVINLKSSMLRDFKIPYQSPPVNNY
jgi:hypothetical protein